QSLAHQRFLQNYSRVFTGARQYLKPEVSHLVGGFVARDDALRRAVRVARVAGGVVVSETHRDRRPRGQKDRALVSVDRLPVQIPILDPDQRLLRSVGQRRQSLKVFPDVMRVWIDG